MSGRGAYYKAKYGNRGRSHGMEGASGHDNEKKSRCGGSQFDAPKSADDLQRNLQRIHNAQYGAYKDLMGYYEFKSPAPFTFGIIHCQGDAYAPPSHLLIRIPVSFTGIPESLLDNRSKRIAISDFIARSIFKLTKTLNADRHCDDRGWSGRKGGEIGIENCSQHIVERNNVAIVGQDLRSGMLLEAKLSIALPARGRTIDGIFCSTVIFQSIPTIVEQCMLWKNIRQDKATSHILSAEDQDILRGLLKTNDLVAFVADGSVLPRLSGASDQPIDSKICARFNSPASLLREFSLPNSGIVSGMAVPKGVTVIVGGGFHGKSTLLRALEIGVYNHIPGDGRELVVADPTAVKIRAEDGRSVQQLNISPFINNLPHGKPTVSFSTSNASGSTSQAANTIEALEAGSTLLLLDEDSCATNLMVRDDLMASLVGAHREPITTFLARVRELYDVHGVSSIIVVGGCGAYLGVADTVIMMDAYQARDVTLEAKALCAKAASALRPIGAMSVAAAGSVDTDESLPPPAPGVVSSGSGVMEVSTSFLQGQPLQAPHRTPHRASQARVLPHQRAVSATTGGGGGGGGGGDGGGGGGGGGGDDGGGGDGGGGGGGGGGGSSLGGGSTSSASSSSSSNSIRSSFEANFVSADSRAARCVRLSSLAMRKHGRVYVHGMGRIQVGSAPGSSSSSRGGGGGGGAGGGGGGEGLSSGRADGGHCSDVTRAQEAVRGFGVGDTVLDPSSGGYSDEDISLDLSAVEQVVEPGQSRAIVDAFEFLARRSAGSASSGAFGVSSGRTSSSSSGSSGDGRSGGGGGDVALVPLRSLLAQLEAEMDSKGLSVLQAGGDSFFHGNLSRPRPFEIAAAINRWRKLQCT